MTSLRPVLIIAKKEEPHWVENCSKESRNVCGRNKSSRKRPPCLLGWMASKISSASRLQKPQDVWGSRSADLEAIRSELPALQQIISNYDPSNVFIMDKTGLLYCIAADRTISARKIGGMKKDKTRKTVALCSDSMAVKRGSFFIGHSEKPRVSRKRVNAVRYTWIMLRQCVSKWQVLSQQRSTLLRHAKTRYVLHYTTFIRWMLVLFCFKKRTALSS